MNSGVLFSQLFSSRFRAKPYARGTHGHISIRHVMAQGIVQQRLEASGLPADQREKSGDFSWDPCTCVCMNTYIHMHMFASMNVYVGL